MTDPKELNNLDSIVDTQQKATRSEDQIRTWLIEQIAELLSLSSADIDIYESLDVYGLASRDAVALSGDLEVWLGRRLSPTLIYEYPTIATLARHLGGAEKDEPEILTSTGLEQSYSRTEPDRTEPIAIVGTGCHFPGAHGPAAFWQMLHQGIEGISEVPQDRWDIDALYDATPATPGKMITRFGGFIDGVDQFDPAFFAISPREAERMDPQQRLLAKTTWEALEHAGIANESLAGSKTGVFIGISNNDYSLLQQDGDYTRIDAYTGTGNAFSIAANRLSYLFDFRGPSIAVDTACSSSLVSVHMACQSLRNGESDLAVAGGVSLMLSPEITITFSQARMLSPSGHCRTFDASADGYVRGEGVGIVVLKRLRDAQQDGDRILALIHGSAINQDGRSQGLTAPNGLSQQQVIREAQALAGIRPEQIDYIETHGTATPLGDPIEAQSLGAVMEGRAPGDPCLIGSVKTNIGHLEASAGVAGLIKTVLALHHEQIPPHLHFQEINPHIPIDRLPLAITTQLTPWPRSDSPRFAGVSSFGFGGTNAHVVLSEAPPTPQHMPLGGDRPAHLLSLSTRHPLALRQLAVRYQHLLEQPNASPLSDVCYSANVGRTQLPHRLAVTAHSTEEMVARLDEIANDRFGLGAHKGEAKSQQQHKIAFLFTGQGSQYTNMGRQLYETQPTFRAALDRCATFLDDRLEQPLLSVLYPDSSVEPLIHETAFTQPALFALEYALAQLWLSWGIQPDYLIGHSIGEYAAACIAGIFSLEDGLKLVAERGRLMQSLPRDGAMAVIFADIATVGQALAPHQQDASIAGINGPATIVISGRTPIITALTQQFQGQGIETRLLNVSHAFHSPLMDPILDEFEQIAGQVHYDFPAIPIISNVTGQQHLPNTLSDARYWRKHIRMAVQFDMGMQTLAQHGCDLYLEMGPHPVLIGMGRRATPETKALWLPSLHRKQSDWDVLLSSVSQAWINGIGIDWRGFDRDYARSKVDVPTYPFQDQRYWLDTTPVALSSRKRMPFQNGKWTHALLRKNEDVQGDVLSGDVILLDESGLPVMRAEGVRLQSLDQDDQQRLIVDLGLDRQEREPSGVVETEVEAELIDREALLAAGSADRPTMLAHFLRTQVAQVLHLSPDLIDTNQPVTFLGLDSIMAIELKNAVERALMVDLPIAAVVEGPSLNQLMDLLLPQLSEEGVSDAVKLTSLGNVVGDHPLSYGQRAMWLQHQVAPDSVFNPTYAVRIPAQLDINKLHGTFQQLIDRHPTLRTTFPSVGGEPVQRVAEHGDVFFDRVDASDWSDVTLRSKLAEVACQIFDLEKGPLLHVHLFSRSEQEHVLLLTAHHIVVDLWSLAVLIYEVGELYAADASALQPLALHYTDYVQWQYEILNDAQGEKLWSYWQDQMAGPLPLLDLPIDRPRPLVQSHVGRSQTLHLSADLTQSLKKLSEGQNATLYMTLLAAFQVLLHRYSGQDDIIVGSPTTGRSQPGLTDIVGYFVNPVALHADLSGNPIFVDFLAQVRQTVLGALRHQDYPFTLLVEKLQPERSASHLPIFQVMFVLQRAHLLHEEGLSQLSLDDENQQMNLGGLPLQSFPIEQLTAPFDITLMMAESPAGLAASLTYNTTLFDDATASRLLGHLHTLLKSIIANPEQEIGVLPLLTAAESSRLLDVYNGTKRDIPDLCVHKMFEAHARRTPHAVAVVFERRRLTYRELDERANRLAHYLRRRGVGPEIAVGLFIERSLDMVVGLLAILKAGGAYVPIDPTYPKERVALMLKDAQPPVLLTQGQLMDGLPETEAHVVRLDQDWLSIAEEPTTTPTSEITPDNLAYVIFTSGSTGRPKGVMLTHRGLTNLVMAQTVGFQIGPMSRVLQFASLSFDAAVSEVFTTLANGAELHLARREELLSPERLGRLLQEQRITTVTLPPSLLREMSGKGFPELKTVVSAGEACQVDIARTWATGRRFINAYGPTEATVGPTYHIVQDLPAGSTNISIGKPIANNQIHIMGRYGQMAPTGVSGEIFIGGVGVARGYLNRPGLTAEKFIPDPFSDTPGGRLYRTGDLARRSPDGSIEFLGRIDHQVKVRGFRIELGEIDAQLKRHPNVRDAVTLAREDQPGNVRLVSYVLPVPEQEPAADELRTFIQKDLPEYMTPAIFIALDALPLTPSGKVDRKALPAPTSERPQLSTAYVAPSNPLERTLAELWQEVLGIEKVGTRDNFFDLGGHSLLLARVHSKMQDIIDEELTMVELFRYPTIAALAERLGGSDSQNRLLQSVYDRAKQQQARRRRRRSTNRSRKS